MTAKPTASGILDAIRARYPNTALLREVCLNDPTAIKPGDDGWDWTSKQPPSMRRIDGLLFQGNQQRTAIEVKVSRADFLRETDAKRDPWRAVVHRFVYATPVGLVRPDEIPTGCGLWTVDADGRVKVVVRARVNKTPEPIPGHVLTAMAYRLDNLTRRRGGR